MNTLCVIPARGGSKRIPLKNVRAFCGKPMIAWPIEVAQASGLFRRIIVSTDDERIAGIAREFGAEAPFLRPPELSDDRTPTLPVIRHAIEWMERAGVAVEFACQILPTASLLSSSGLQAGFDALGADKDLEFAFGVTQFEFPIFRALQLDGDQRVRMFWPENELARSQDLPAAFHDAGQFVWGRREAWLTRERIFSARSRGIVIPPERVQDIDTEEDWRVAEWKFQALAGS